MRHVIGDKAAWEMSHSLDGLGKRAATFTDKAAVRDELAREFARWWKGSHQVFPEP